MEQTEAIVENREKLAAHEAVCALRYAAIQKELTGVREMMDTRMRRNDLFTLVLAIAVFIGPGTAGAFVGGIFKKLAGI